MPNGGASTSRSGTPITTYVRQRPLFEEEDEDQINGFHKNSTKRSISLERLGIRPHSSRTKAFFCLLSDWEGRDALLQFAQSVSLLAYSSAPFQRKPLHLASEGFANARRLLIVGRWLNEGLEALHERWKSKKSDKNDSSSSSAISSEEEVIESNRQLTTIGTLEEKSLLKDDTKGRHGSYEEDFHESAIRDWRKTWHRRIGLISEYMTMAGEGCEVVAFLGGTGVMWRIMGNKLAARQRHGLERIAQIIFLFAFALTLRHIEHLRLKRLTKLRKTNQQLLRAADRLTEEEDASTLLQADHLSIAEALSHNRNKSTLKHLQTHDLELREKGASESYRESALRRAEYELFLQRKKMQLLKLERTSVRAELIFVIAEIFLPQYDHARLEGWTTLIASLCHMSRLTKQTRWH